MDEYLDWNRALWDEWTPAHVRSRFYDVEGFKRGGVRIRPFETEEVGDVRGRDLLHLQCHFGLDTLSWARLGARVTGVDFSARAIDAARRLAEEVGLEARFVHADVYSVPDVLGEGGFDVVYTSRGVIPWLPDLEPWGRVIARSLRPGGRFYIHEGHPVMWILDDERDDRELRLRYPYFHRDLPLRFPVTGSYADPDARIEHDAEYAWLHSLGDVVSSVAGAGLRIEFLHEHPSLDWPLPFLEERDGAWWLPEGTEAEVPLSFSLLATKPE